MVRADIFNSVQAFVYARSPEEFAQRVADFRTKYASTVEVASVVAYLEKYWLTPTWTPLWSTAYRRGLSMLGLTTTAHIEGLFGQIKQWLIRAERDSNGVRIMQLLHGLPGTSTPNLVQRKSLLLRAAQIGASSRGFTRASEASRRELLERLDAVRRNPTLARRLP